MANIFSKVPVNRPGRSVFNLSYEKLFTCDMGKLIPIMADEVVPGDVWDIGNQVVVRFQPLVAPILHPIYVTVHYFFAPYRVLCKHPNVNVDWEAFITGGPTGTDATTLPTWDVTTNTVGSLWDYLGFPVGVDAVNARPLKFPLLAYNWIWNEYYRDENVQSEVNISTSEVLQSACWEKDYFTSALPWQQRGTAPAIPLGGVINVESRDTDIQMTSGAGAGVNRYLTGVVGETYMKVETGWSGASGRLRFFQDYTGLKVNLASAGTFNITDLRLALSIQKWMERNARAGARYVEWLKAHFGVAPNDDRLDRPEYIGGSKQPVIISEVLQTSKTDVSPQGNMAGHGISVSRNYCAKLRAPEYGIVMGIMCVRPVPMYHQGIDRQWLRTTRYDFYHPEFADLSEQPVLERELYCSGVSGEHITVFGYAGRYDEMRYKKNMICGDMHVDFDHWHLCRNFSARPTLNSAFVTCDPRKDIFAAPAEDGLIVRFGNVIRAVRPLPFLATPGGLFA